MPPTAAPPSAPCLFSRTGPAQGGDLAALTATEWLLTGGNGGFSMGTAAGIPTRRYHGLLIASLRPPVNRLMALAAVAETLTAQSEGDRFELATFNFAGQPVGAPRITGGGALHPDGFRCLTGFEKDAAANSVRWHYRAQTLSGQITVLKTLHRLRDHPGALIHYAVSNPTPYPATLIVTPLVALRDFHALLLRDLNPARFTVTQLADAAVAVTGTVTHGAATPPTLHLWFDHAATPPRPVDAFFTADHHWWYNFAYPIEASRGYDSLEDLFSPGRFTLTAPPGDSAFTLRASLTAAAPGGTGPGGAGLRPVPGLAGLRPAPPEATTLAAAEQHARARAAQTLTATRLTLGPAFDVGGPLEDHPILSRLPTLVSAADDFVIKRVRPGSLPGAPADRVSIIAGYPWFADWGRDTMISLPGLLLCCGRFAEARAVLETFAGACKDGLIPNVFDDYTGTPHYNTVDASLWFVHAACQYLAESGDAETFNATLLPACADIIDCYSKGTGGAGAFNIRVDDTDGLVRAGDPTTQLTWMDAKRDGVVFTPRHGKPVEINALWYNALRSLAHAAALPRPADAARWSRLADRVGPAFRARYWNPGRACLFDLITDQGDGVPEIRPNQLLAVSLPHSALDADQQKGVVAACTQTLYTPMGVRTLEPGDWRYKGRFRGRMFDRDAAYHNGTAWPWLLGPLAEATARAGGWSSHAVAQAQRLLGPILGSLDGNCCGQIPEVY
ncbi:MAG: glycogen debranching enzyme N-terminal domain-containing protein, partial [Phycisphaerales bacterium]|nr:glycogen debranching enzyme N-terminal domain-containing protein [Phycisphaerales bacterium]